MMSALSFVALLVTATVCCGASVVKREALQINDICAVTSVDIYDGADFDLTSPNYGLDRYPNNANCVTALQSDKEALVLKLTFEAEDIELHSQCVFDSLCLNGVKICGSWAVKKSFRFLLPASSSFSVGFNTDYSVTGAGLSVRIEVRAATSDDEIFQADSGVGSTADRITYRQVSDSPEYLRTYTDRCAGNNNQQYGWNYTSSSNDTWEYYTSPSYNESGNNYTSPSYTGNWTTSSSSNGSWGNNTTRPYTSGNNYTSPSSNSSWSYSTTRSNNGNWTTSSNNGNLTTTRSNNGNLTTSSSNGNWTTTRSNSGNLTTTRSNNGNLTTSSNNGNWTTTRSNNGNYTTSSNNGNWTTSSNNGNWTTTRSNYTTTSNGTRLSTTLPPNRNSTNSPVTTTRPAARSG